MPTDVEFLLNTTFAGMQEQAYEISKSRGWYQSEAENIAGKIALIHAELSEALEEYRDDNMELYFDEDHPNEAGLAKPEGFGIELADTVIRIMDLSQYLSIDLEYLIKLKMEYNKNRTFRHGGKKI